MPRIPDHLLDAVVYLYSSVDDAINGRSTGGSGFLVALTPTDAPAVIFVVTNFHVDHGGNLTVRLNSQDGGVRFVTIPGDSWVQHQEGDDIAAAEIEMAGLDVYVRPWSIEEIEHSFAGLAGLEPGVGDEVVMLGRFAGHSGIGRNEPVARFGNVARMAGGELVRDGRGERVDAFLVDMRSQAGYSGSPVLIYVEPVRADGNMIVGTQRLAFLGIDTGHKYLRADVVDQGGELTGHSVTVNSGIAIVAPYYKVAELILSAPEFAERRERGAWLR